MTESEYRAKLAEAKRFDVVRVRWRDSSRLGLGWSRIEEYESAALDSMYGLEESTGYYLGENAAFITLVQSIREWRPSERRDPNANDGIIIPHEAVRLFEILAAGDSLDRSFGDEPDE